MLMGSHFLFHYYPHPWTLGGLTRQKDVINVNGGTPKQNPDLGHE